MKDSIPFLCLILILFSITAAAAPEDVYHSLGVSEGKVTALAESQELCSDGPFKFVGKKDDEILMVGSAITFYPPTKGKVKAVAPDAETCGEDVLSSLQGKKLTMITTIHTCPKDQKQLESVTEESIEVNKDTIKYVRKGKQGKRECLLKWMVNEEK